METLGVHLYSYSFSVQKGESAPNRPQNRLSAAKISNDYVTSQSCLERARLELPELIIPSHTLDPQSIPTHT